MFIPTTKEELVELGWENLDVILISGDTYIDYSYNGIAIIGHLLIDKGYKVGIIAQPDVNSSADITRLGEPKLFWGISSGSVDSMISNYTPTGKKRTNDDLTPGGINNKRPDRALIVYTNLIRRYYKNTCPIILGGIEASLRRITHYDCWTNSIRRSILFDAKADILVYGMAESAIIDLAEKIKAKQDYKDIRGICYIDKIPNKNFISLPSYEESVNDKNEFMEMFKIFYNNSDPVCSSGLNQRHDNRYLIHNPPASLLTQDKLDYIYNLKYERDVHPFYKKTGAVKALDTARFSITTHRGCYGECNFCAISVHQGNTIVSRSKASIIKEAVEITDNAEFKGTINDIGGPTANMYGFECEKKINAGKCTDKRCIFPDNCNNLSVNHKPLIDLLKELKNLPKIKNIFIASGIRYDLILSDKKYGEEYLKYIMENHISGQMKIAPEHSENEILKLMGKPSNDMFVSFLKLFNKISLNIKKKIFLTFYYITAHPGTNEGIELKLKKFIKSRLKITPEQIQIFTPSPSTYSSLMYYTGINPFSGENIFVERDNNKKKNMKDLIQGK